MKVRAIKGKTEERFETYESSSLGIVGYGRDNLYPDILRNAVLGSSTATECVERFGDFIEGGGFVRDDLGSIVVNFRGETLDDVHALVSQDLALYNGFALHVQYNVFCEVVSVSHVPFACTRLTTPDDWGYVAKIAVHPDWSGRLYRNGKRVAVTRANIDYYNIFNPDKDIIAREMEMAGGATRYGGQILWVSLSGASTYPVGRCDRIFTDLLTDAGLSNVKYRNVCCNFLPSGMVVTRRGASTEGMTEDELKEKDRNAETLTSALRNLQGDTNAGKLLEATVEQDEEKPEFVRIESTNYDKAFSVTEESVTQRIYSAFGQEAWHCIRIGKTGFSGSILVDAFDYYNTLVSKQRRVIERAFEKIFAVWYNGVISNFEVQPLKFVSSEGGREI